MKKSNFEWLGIFAGRKSFHDLKLKAKDLKSGLWAVFLMSAVQAHAASLTSGADFLLMTPGARPDGMGQAFSAVADDVDTLTFNPAGLGNILLPEIGYGHEDFLAGIGYDFVGAAVPLGSSGVLGLGYLGLGTAPFNSTSSASTPAVSAQDTALIADWGMCFNNLQLGAGIEYIDEKLSTVEGTGFGFDFGALYRVTPRLALAGSVLNLGPGVQFSSMEPLPMVVNGGVAFTALEDPSYRLTLAADASDEVTDATQRFSVGAEYWYQKTFALRAGYLANSQTEGFSAGAGIRYSFFQLDYAFEPYNNLGTVNRLSGIFRWDGPWIPGSELNAPQNVTVRQKDFQTMEVQWDKASGPVRSYEVMTRPLNGGNWTASQPVTGTIFDLKNYSPGTAYSIAVISMGDGGSRSYPSPEVHFTTPDEKGALELAQQEGGSRPPKSVFNGLTAKVDSVGLELSWAVPRERGISGYNLYRKPPGGQAVKVTREPTKSNRVWLINASEDLGCQWTVTSVNREQKERTIGTCVWYPTGGELAQIGAFPGRRLSAVAQPDREVFLAWDGEPAATGYMLFYSPALDGVYEVLKAITTADTNLLMKVPGNQDAYSFIVVPVNSANEWYPRSQEATVTLSQSTP